MVPILEVMKEPTLPAIMTEQNVGANSKMIDCRVAKPIRFLGIKSLVRFIAVWIETTAPMKKEINTRIPKEP